MENALITLKDPATVVADLQKLIQSHHRVILLVLGNSPVHVKLANDAVPFTDAGPGLDSFRFVVLATQPQVLYPAILSMPLDPQCGTLPASFNALYGVSISMDGTVCDQVKDVTVSDINLAFMMAETHHV